MADPTAVVATTEAPAGTPLHRLPVCQHHVDGWHVVCRSSPSLPPSPPARVTDTGMLRAVAQALVVLITSSSSSSSSSSAGVCVGRASGSDAAPGPRGSRQHQQAPPPTPSTRLGHTIHTAYPSPLTHVPVQGSTRLWLCSDHSDVHAHSSFEVEVLPRLPPTAAASWSAASASSKVRLRRGELEAGDDMTDAMAKHLFDGGCTTVSSDGMEVQEVVTVKCVDTRCVVSR